AERCRTRARQTTAKLEHSDDRYLVACRPVLGEMSSSTVTGEVLATRGNRPSLGRTLCVASGHSVGPSELATISILETNEHGDMVTLIEFDPDELDAAYAELDDRYAAGEAAGSRHMAVIRAFCRAFAARDWDALATQLAPDL